MNRLTNIAVVGLIAVFAAGCTDYDPTSKDGREKTREELKNRGYIDTSKPVGAPEKKAEDKDAPKDASKSEVQQ